MTGDLTRSRVAVGALFALLGMSVGSWAARIPGVRQQVPLDDAHWGLLILGAPVGTLTALAVVARLIPQVGARRLAIIGAVGVLIAVPVSTTAHHAWVLGLALIVQGLSGGLLTTPMNALAVLVERQYQRRIMSSFHALFSAGQLAGGGFGALLAGVGVSPTDQLVPTSALLAVVFVVTLRWLPHDLAPAGVSVTEGPAAPRARTRPSRQLVLLATIALLSSVCEGAAVQWSAQYGAVTLGAGAGVGALTLVAYSVAMTFSRIFGDRFVGRLGRVRFLKLSALVAAAGMGVGLLVDTTLSGFIGFALLGVGCACLVPTTIGLAGNQPGVPTGRGVAVVSLGQWPAYLVGPPLIGFVSDLVGLRAALGVTVVAVLLVSLLAGRVREPAAL